VTVCTARAAQGRPQSVGADARDVPLDRELVSKPLGKLTADVDVDARREREATHTADFSGMVTLVGVPPDPRRRRQVGPNIVSGVFKMAAIVVLGAGGLAAYGAADGLSALGASHGNAAVVAVAIVAGTIFLAAALLFFAYVLDLLVDIDDDILATVSRPPPGQPL